MHLKSFSLISISILLAGCITVNTQPAATTPPSIITSTLAPTLTPQPSDTPLPPTPQPTASPIEGIASTQVNVRSEPSTACKVLGVIPAKTKVQIIAKDSGGNWYQIVYPKGQDGKGWAAAQYITTADKSVIPVIGGGGLSANIATMTQKVNVRSGPGTSFNSIGTLNQQDVANLTGKNSDGTWLQIEFATGPEGKGWISAAFVQAKGAENIPIVAESGQVVGTGTPTGIPLTITPTLIPALDDHDSAQSPAISVDLSTSGTRGVQYSSDVSSPQGDSEDWIQFTSSNTSVLIKLDCAGNGNLIVELSQNGSTLQNSNGVTCGTNQIINVIPSQPRLIHLKAADLNIGLQFVAYTLYIESKP